MRFAPNTADIRQPVTIHTRQNVKILKNKQKIFLERTARLSSGAIQGLDYVEPSIGITLRQAVMDIRSQETSLPLFIAVSEDNWSSRVTFLFTEDRMDEAVTLIPALPIIMAAQYGPRVWSWFNEDAVSETAGWFYDVDTGVVCSEEDRQTSAIINEEYESDSEDDEGSASPPMGTKMDLSFLSGGITARIGTNTYGDSGTINTAALQSSTPIPRPFAQAIANANVEHDDDDSDSTPMTSGGLVHSSAASLAASGASTWDVTSQASTSSIVTNKSVTVKRLLYSIKATIDTHIPDCLLSVIYSL
jgi:hypothetical protein